MQLPISRRKTQSRRSFEIRWNGSSKGRCGAAGTRSARQMASLSLLVRRVFHRLVSPPPLEPTELLCVLASHQLWAEANNFLRVSVKSTSWVKKKCTFLTWPIHILRWVPEIDEFWFYYLAFRIYNSRKSVKFCPTKRFPLKRVTENSVKKYNILPSNRTFS